MFFPPRDGRSDCSPNRILAIVTKRSLVRFESNRLTYTFDRPRMATLSSLHGRTGKRSPARVEFLAPAQKSAPCAESGNRGKASQPAVKSQVAFVPKHAQAL